MTEQVRLRDLIDPRLIGALALEGLSASRIAGRINETLREKLAGPVTKNTIIGLAKRCGVSLNPPKVAAAEGRRGRRNQRERTAPRGPAFVGAAKPPERAREDLARLKAQSECADALAPRVSILDLKHDSCRWPLGDPLLETFAYCGSVATRGSYCAGHAAIGYQPPQNRARKGLVAEAAASYKP